jgi:hypothetical protein
VQYEETLLVILDVLGRGNRLSTRECVGLGLDAGRGVFHDRRLAWRQHPVKPRHPGGSHAGAIYPRFNKDPIAELGLK